MIVQPAAGESATERMAAWRALLCSALAKAMALLTLPGAVWLIVDAHRLGVRAIVWVMVLFVVSSVTCALAPVRTRGRAMWLLGNLTVASWLLATFAGFQGGLGAAILSIGVLGALLLGTRGGVAALAVVWTGLMLWVLLMLFGTFPRPSPQLSDAGQPLFALRSAFVSGTLAVVALLAVSHQIRQLFRTLEESQRLVAAQHAEMAAREEEARRRRQAEEGLIRAQKLEAIGRLAGGLAHDVNNNLTVLLTGIELIERTDKLSATGQRLATTMREACENASLLTRQLLALGRREVSNPAAVSLRVLLPRLERLLDTLLGSKVELEVRVDEDIPPVWVDPQQLEQVILNLAINARDAMREGGNIVISAELTRSFPSYQLVTSEHVPERAVSVHVTDTGAGIDEHDLPRLGEPFFTTKGDKGTGLGLAAARAFAEGCGGRLGVRTRHGSGSTFTIELPLAPAFTTSPAPQRMPSSARVLVVDDDPRVRASIVTVLMAEGYQVLEASDGAEGLERAHGQHVDLLCTDAVMPRMGAEEFISRFVALHPAARVLVCSAYVREESLRALVRGGHYAALSKPFATAELRDAVRRALTENRPVAPSHHAPAPL